MAADQANPGTATARFRTPVRSAGAEEPAARVLLLQFALACVLVRVALEIVGLLSVRQRRPDVGGQILDLWSHTDAPHYLRIADIGYSPQVTPQDDQVLVGFFPAYPAAIRLVHLLTGEFLIAGLLVSFAASVGACWFLYRLVRLRGDHGTAWRAVILMLAAPTAYFMAAPYTESMFLCSTLAAVYAARTGRWAMAGLAGAVASATRVVGFALWPLLVIEVLRQCRGTRERVTNLAWCSLAGTGLAAFMVLNQIVYGTPTKFIEVQKSHWDQGLAWPWEPLRDAWTALEHGSEGTLHFIMWTRLAAFAVVAPLLVLGLRRLPISDSVFAWVTFLFVLSSVWLLSLPRYVFVIYPLFVLGAQLTARRRVFVPVVAGSAVLQAWWFWRYTGGHWAF